MAKVIGLVNLHGNVNYSGLTNKRPAASVSFLGRYAIVDFVLSNFSNSGIDNVGVLVQDKPRSIIKHLGGGTSWNLNQKRGGLSTLYNEKYANNASYNTDINNLEENLGFIYNAKADYVVVAPAHVVNTINYADVVDAHEKSGADVTLVYSKIKNADTAFIDGDVVKVEDGKVTSVSINKGTAKNKEVSLNTYVFKTDALLKMVKDAAKESAFYTLKDMVDLAIADGKVNAYQYKGYLSNVDSLVAYYKTSLELINMEYNSMVFKSNWPIFTNTNDTPPTKYLKNSSVKKAFVANGAIIDGTVENSIIGREVKIEKGAVVKNCIILSDAKIGAGAKLENVIVDKHAQIIKKKELKGEEDAPLFVYEGDII